jgi:hypothetical protein
LNACLGLPVPLVEGTEEMCIIMLNRGERPSQPISTGNSYRYRSFDYCQREFAVFDLDLGELVMINDPDAQRVEPWKDVEVPQGVRRHTPMIQKLLEYLSDKLGVPVELEGAIHGPYDETTLDLFQLTKSHRIPNALEMLTEVETGREIFNNKGVVTGSLQYSGDVLFCDERFSKKKARKIIDQYASKGRELLFVSTGFPEEMLPEAQVNNYVNVGTMPRFVKSLGYDGAGYVNIHLLGYKLSEVHRRKEKGDNTCCIEIDEAIDFDSLRKMKLGNFKGRRKKPWFSNMVLFEDVTFEALEGRYQIYFNQ